MADWVEEYMTAKYHVSIARRMYTTYASFPEKRFLVGVIKELSKASGKTIRAYLRYTNKHELFEFTGLVAKQYLRPEVAKGLLTVLEIEKAQALSPVQFSKDDKIIFLVDNIYKVLTVKRLGEFLEAVEEALKSFPKKV
jgi:hypothetical protein